MGDPNGFTIEVTTKITMKITNSSSITQEQRAAAAREARDKALRREAAARRRRFASATRHDADTRAERVHASVASGDLGRGWMDGGLVKVMVKWWLFDVIRWFSGVRWIVLDG